MVAVHTFCASAVRCHFLTRQCDERVSRLRIEAVARYASGSEVTVAGSGEKWRWADPQGAQRVVHFDELRAALASGTLPPYTLVWRSGMVEWQPAYLVGELATAAISAREGVIPNVPPPPMHIVAVQAEYERRAEDQRGVGSADQPPPPPVHQYAAIVAAMPAHMVRPRPSAPHEVSPSPPAVSPGARSAVREPTQPRAASASNDDEGVLPTIVARPVVARATAMADAAAKDKAAADDEGVLETLVARPAIVPGPPATSARATGRTAPVVSPRPNATQAVAAPGGERDRPAPSSASSAPLGGVPQARPSLAPPPRKSYPGAGGSAPPQRSVRQTIPGPGSPPLPLGSRPPMAVPPPAAVPRSTGSDRPPQAVADAPPGSFPPASGDPRASSRARADRYSDELPSFPLEEASEPGDPLEPSGASLVRDTDQPPADLGAHQGRFGGRAAWQAARQRLVPWTRHAAATVRREVVPRLRQGVAYVRAHPKDPKVLGVLGGGALLVALAMGAMIAGASDDPADQPAAVPAARSLDAPPAATVPEANETTAPATAPAPATAACRLAREATRIAPQASKDVPLELAMGPAPGRAWVGYALDAESARGLAVDVDTGTANEVYAGRGAKVLAVTPVTVRHKPTFAVSADGKRDRLQAWRTVPADPPHVVGWVDGGLAVARRATDAPRTVWSLEGAARPDALRAVVVGEHEVIAFRREGAIWMGVLGAEQASQGPLVRVAGAGAPVGSPVGSPALAANGRAVAVAFADRTSPAEPWGLRIGSAAAALPQLPTQTSPFRVPAGGPGGAALAPAISGLSGGRWILVWTEGSGGRHDVRAQTLAADLTPLGPAFPVSHPDDNAGQGAVAVSADRGFVAYLRLTDQGYEVWGAGLDCR